MPVSATNSLNSPPVSFHADAPQYLVRMIRLRDEEGNATTYLSNLIDRSRRAV